MAFWMFSNVDICNKNLFPNVFKFLQLFAILPVPFCEFGGNFSQFLLGSAVLNKIFLYMVHKNQLILNIFLKTIIFILNMRLNNCINSLGCTIGFSFCQTRRNRYILGHTQGLHKWSENLNYDSITIKTIN